MITILNYLKQEKLRYNTETSQNKIYKIMHVVSLQIGIKLWFQHDFYGKNYVFS